MSRVCSFYLSLVAWLAGLATVHGEEAKPRTDLYGDPLPPGAVARLGTIRLRHARADVTFSTDGKQLISCDGDGEIRFWDVATGKLLRRKWLRGKPDKEMRYRKVILSPGGATALVWDRKWAYLYDTTTGKKRCQIPVDPGGNEPLLTFSADSRMLAVQIRECGALVQELWDVVEGKKLQRLDARMIANVPHIAFAPDGKHLAGAGHDGYVSGRIYLWDTATGKEIARGSDSIVTHCLAFSSDGKTLAAGSWARGKIWLLDAATLQEKIKLKEPDHGWLDRIDRLAFSPDGRLLAGLSSEFFGTHLLIWSLDGSSRVRRLSGPLDRWFAFAPNSKTLIGRSGSEMSVWDMATGRQLHHRPGHDQSVDSLTVSRNGKYIASLDESRTQLKLWDSAAGKLMHTMKKEDGRIESCLFSPDSKQVIAVGVDCVAQIGDIGSGRELRRLAINRHRPEMIPRPDAVGISPDGKRLLAVTSDWGKAGTAWLSIWDLAAGKIRRQRRYRGRPEAIMPEIEYRDHAAFSPDGERVTVWLGDRIGIEEIATGSLLAMLPKGVSQSIIFAPDGRLVAAPVEQAKLPQGDGHCLSLIEAVSGEEIARLETCGSSYMAFTPDSRAVVLAEAKKLSVWDTLTGERLHEMPWPGEVIDAGGETRVSSLAVLPNGRAATGMGEGDILIWDLEPEKWPHSKPGPVLDHKELNALWSDLAGNARGACRAIHKLAAAPSQSVAFLNEHIRSPAALDTHRIEKLLVDLDSDSFTIRDTASQELARLRYRIEAMLRGALENKLSLEKRRRVEAILAEPSRPPREALRTRRAIAVLERIGTPVAWHILEKLAAGAASPETREAQAALRRLKLRTASAKEIIAP